jgi:hypothetical protein
LLARGEENPKVLADLGLIIFQAGPRASRRAFLQFCSSLMVAAPFCDGRVRTAGRSGSARSRRQSLSH